MDTKKRNNRKKEEEGAINKLPEDLLIQILSFLPTKVAVSTMVLSKRWRNLFTLIPNLDLDDSIFRLLPSERGRARFAEFVNKVLVFRSRNSPVTKFSLSCHRPVTRNLVDYWLLKALERGAIDVTFSSFFFPSRYSLPSSFFSYSQNLIKLSLLHGKLHLTHGDFAFTKLKTLHLTHIVFHDGLALLLSKCPVLEDLVLLNCAWKSTPLVTCPTLKRLTFNPQHGIPNPYNYIGVKDLRYIFNPETRLAFDSPNLLYLNYTGYVPRNYPMVELDSLVEANLNVELTKCRTLSLDSHSQYKIDRKVFTDLIMRIRNVQTLHLFSVTLEGLGETIPVFRNLNHLSIQINNEGGLRSLPRFLINCPNLKTLTIHGQRHIVPRDGFLDTCDDVFASCYSCLSSCPVKVLKLLEFGATFEEMSIVKYLLNNLNMLEKAIIICSGYNYVDEVSQELDTAPKASLKCKLEVRT